MANPALQLYLAAALKQAPRRRQLRRAPRPLRPALQQRVYLRDILRLLKPARELVERRVVPRLHEMIQAAGYRADDGPRAEACHRADDKDPDLPARTFDSIRVEYQGTVPDDEISSIARGAGSQTQRFNGQQLDRQIKTVLGVDVYRSEPWLQPSMNGFTRENVKLIKSISGKYFDEIEDLVQRGVRAGRQVDQLAQDIADRFGVAESRAALIARDQIGKFNGQLTELRQQDLGISRYRWRNSRDERVRGNPTGLYPRAKPSHWDREGEIFEWSKPPEGGHPGEAVQCRCWAEPVFEDILGPEFQMDLTPAPAATAYTPSTGLHSSGPGILSAPESSLLTPAMEIEDAEDIIRHSAREHLGVFDSEGKLIHTAMGDASSVPVSPQTMKQMRDDGNATLTHNHPRGSPPSPEDLALAMSANLREVRATRPEGGAWVVTRPAGGWGFGEGDESKLLKQLGKLYNGALDVARDRMDAQIITAGGKPGDVHGKGYSDENWRRFIAEEVTAAYNGWAKQHGWRVRLQGGTK